MPGAADRDEIATVISHDAAPAAIPSWAWTFAMHDTHTGLRQCLDRVRVLDRRHETFPRSQSTAIEVAVYKSIDQMLSPFGGRTR